MADDSNENMRTVHVGDSGDENRQGGDGIEIMDLGGGADTADGGGGKYNIVLGGSGNDDLTISGIRDIVLGGSGDDTITVNGFCAIVRGGSGADTIYGLDNAWSMETLRGDGGNDTIYGRAGWDTIYGGAGNDIIDGGAGRDKIVGGEGDDTLTGGSGADIFYFWEDHGTDTITDFNVAEDKIFLRYFDQTITWDQLSSKITTVTDENNVVTGVQIDLSDWGGGTIILEGITAVSDLTEDMFYLNTIAGGDGDDKIYGGTDDDTMSGGAGADTFYFNEGYGADTITDFSTTDGDKIHLTSFSASITWEQLQAAMTDVADDTTTMDVDETAVVIDLSAWGGGSITLEGVSSSDLTADMFVLDTLHGEDGSDDGIKGGTSDDTMSGGTGADTFYFYRGHGADTITDFSTTEGDVISLNCLGGKITWAELSAAFTDVADDTTTMDVDETATVIDLSAWGGGSITLEGVSSSDLTADMFNLPDGSTSRYIVGNSEDETLTGSHGRDLIFGEEGDDTISGGADNDSLFGGEGADVLDGGEGDDLLLGGEGNDTLTGGAGEDMLIGGEGDDELTGGGDADTFVFGEDNGSDTITDFDTANDKIDLTTFDASITWAQLSAVISAIEDDPNTPEIESGTTIDLSSFGGGTITLEGVTSTDLTADMFILDDFAGTTGDDTIESTSADNRLTGGGGADTFVFASDHGSDTITDFTVDTDTIDLSALTDITQFSDLSISDNTDGNAVIDLSSQGGGTITLTGVSTADLDGDDFAFYQNTYTGTASAETLEGGAGDDTITGLGGDDTLTGNEGDDTFVFAASHGSDTITDFTDGEDTIDLSGLSGITGFSDVSGSITQSGNDTVIDLSSFGGGSITLEGFTSTDLSADDFAF